MDDYHFSFDGEPTRSEVTCTKCGEKHDASGGFVLSHNGAYAAYHVEWYPHDDEAWVDAVLGSFKEPRFADDVTFASRYGYVDGTSLPAATLVKPERSGRIYGRLLDRNAALKHKRLPDFWAVFDWLLINDPLLKTAIQALPPQPSNPGTAQETKA